jgi:hypothetical protein
VTNDPLLEPLQLKHPTLRNRIMSTAHDPSYAVDGFPQLQYQLYHEEKAKGGIALTMFGGSTNVSLDSPAVFGNLHAGTDEIILTSRPWPLAFIATVPPRCVSSPTWVDARSGTLAIGFPPSRQPACENRHIGASPKS